jgi:uncharacterized RDD family membrane protein YckC
LQLGGLTLSKKYAVFGLRFIAYIIDSFVIYIIVMPISFMIGFLIGLTSVTVSSDPSLIANISKTVGSAIGIITFICYYAMLEQSKWQATLGKRFMGIIVVDENEGRITITRALVRTLAKYLSALLFLIGYIMAAFTENKQALHDFLAKTYVINVEK